MSDIQNEIDLQIARMRIEHQIAVYGAHKLDCQRKLLEVRKNLAVIEEQMREYELKASEEQAKLASLG